MMHYNVEKMSDWNYTPTKVKEQIDWKKKDGRLLCIDMLMEGECQTKWLSDLHRI